MGQYLEVNTNSVEAFSKKIKESTDSIDVTLDKIIMLTREMDKFFNTPTGRNVKEVMLQFLDNIKKENVELLKYSELINDASVVYNNTINSISESIGGTQNG